MEQGAFYRQRVPKTRYTGGHAPQTTQIMAPHDPVHPGGQTKQPSFTRFGTLPVEIQIMIWKEAAANLDVFVFHFNIDLIRDADREPTLDDWGYFACFTPSADLIVRTRPHRALLAAHPWARECTIKRLGGMLLPINYIPGRRIPAEDSANAVVKQGLVPFDLNRGYFCINDWRRAPRYHVLAELRMLFPDTRNRWDPQHAAAGHAANESWWLARSDDWRVVRGLRGFDALAPAVTRLAFGVPAPFGLPAPFSRSGSSAAPPPWLLLPPASAWERRGPHICDAECFLFEIPAVVDCFPRWRDLGRVQTYGGGACWAVQRVRWLARRAAADLPQRGVRPVALRSRTCLCCPTGPDDMSWRTG